jgi:hypothetical protein
MNTRIFKIIMGMMALFTKWRTLENIKNMNKIISHTLKCYRLKTVVIFIFVAGLLLPTSGLAQSPGKVDFRYSPPEWQTAICLPDDPYKTLVDKNGDLLYHYNQGGREFGTRITVEVTNDVVWKKQELYSPRVPVVKTFQSAKELNILEEAFALNTPTRSDWILVHVTNTSKEQRTLHPSIVVDTKMGLQRNDQSIVINKNERLTASLKIIGITNQKQVQLTTLIVPAGKTVEFSLCYSPFGTIPKSPATLEQAVAYWENAPLPYSRITIPDAGIQGLINSSIRNIWQAREIKGGLTVFQVGPTCYRGLWIVDGAFLLEAATMLGAGDQARNGVAYELSHQKPDGRIEVMKDKFGYWKENGIVLWTCVRHAMLTQDKAWLESEWPKLQRIAGFIKLLRTDQTADTLLETGLIPRGKHTPPDEGLMPHGIIDGGIHDGVEYTNSYWNLVGLRSFIDAARWLGKEEESAVWQKEYDDFMAVFRKAAARDMKADPQGNRYLPILMNGQDLPQRAQWAFCHAVYPGQIFVKDDPLVAGNMAMLEATEHEGIVYGTGWNATGIWNYFASFYGHAWLWQGNGRKAAQALYAFAEHASPTLVWREEQTLTGEKFKKVGDMPHNWASAEFIRLTIHLLALDRGSELHLLEGFPYEWAKPGMITRLNGVLTPFGPLYMELKVAEDGLSAQFKVTKLTGSKPDKIVLHLVGLTGEDVTRELSTKADIDITLRMMPVITK